MFTIAVSAESDKPPRRGVAIADEKFGLVDKPPRVGKYGFSQVLGEKPPLDGAEARMTRVHR